MSLYYLVFLLGFICIINIIYHLLFSKFAFSKQTKLSTETTPTSVIVYIKNQEKILPEYLNNILQQRHLQFELILVNNASSDDSLDILTEFEEKHPNIQVVDVQNNESFWGSKKYAISLGIKKAKYNALLFTTPYTIPASENWITAMGNSLKDEKQLTIGYYNYSASSRFFNKIVRFTQIQHTLKNFGLGTIRKPFSASEHNFGYTSELFFENNGFAEHISIQTGTEDLFLKQNATSKNTNLLTSVDASIKNPHTPNFKQWMSTLIQQKNISKHYSFSIKFHLKTFSYSQLLFWLLAITSAILIPNYIVFSIIGTRFLICGLIQGKTAFKLNEKDTFYWYPIIEFICILLLLPITIGGLFSKK